MGWPFPNVDANVVIAGTANAAARPAASTYPPNNFADGRSVISAHADTAVARKSPW
jgi:hypothetical protein